MNTSVPDQQTRRAAAPTLYVRRHSLMAHAATIEIASRNDAEAILELQQLAYRSEAELYEDWDMPALTESLQQLVAEFDRQVFLKAIGGNSQRIVGSVRGALQEGVCSIGRLIVHPHFQRRGIGRAMMGKIEHHFAQAHRFELFTGHRSSRNLSFYKCIGYVPFREQKLSDTLTLVFLQKQSPNSQSRQQPPDRAMIP